MLHLSLSTATWHQLPYLAAHVFLVQCEEKKLAMVILRWYVYDFSCIFSFTYVASCADPCTHLDVLFTVIKWMMHGNGLLGDCWSCFQGDWEDMNGCAIHPPCTNESLDGDRVVGVDRTLWSKSSSEYNSANKVSLCPIIKCVKLSATGTRFHCPLQFSITQRRMQNSARETCTTETFRRRRLAFGLTCCEVVGLKPELYATIYI